jgi:hypothetical protein
MQAETQRLRLSTGNSLNVFYSTEIHYHALVNSTKLRMCLEPGVVVISLPTCGTLSGCSCPTHGGLYTSGKKGANHAKGDSHGQYWN